MTFLVNDRWESLLSRVPALRPWLAQMVRHRRAQTEDEQALQAEMERWLREFEELPPFAVTAIATTLQDDILGLAPPRALAEQARHEHAGDELAADETLALLADPAFALAFHCVEVRVRPALRGLLARVSESAWFGLLHASARPEPLLTAQTAVALVLRVLGRDWAQTPPEARRAALRLFHASAADLRGDLSRVRAALPREWALAEPDLPAFVAASARARMALGEAGDLCARFVAFAARKGPLSGGLSLLPPGSLPASASELAELGRTAWKYSQMSGFRPLLHLLG